MDNNFLVSISNLSKSFPGIQALDNVDFNLKVGEVHALIGENGAGKSTLIKVLSGVSQKDSGKIEILGKEQNIKSPHYARTLGIATVFQELSQIPTLSVAENIYLGQEGSKSKFFLKRNQFIKETIRISQNFEIEINPKEIVQKLSSAQRQIVEIIKALSQNPKILILDEPTSSLTENEAQKLFDLIGDLKKSGVGIIYISHRMNEIFKISDRITILRDGKLVSQNNTEELNIEKVVNLMVGREIEIYNSDFKSADKSLNNKAVAKALEVKNFTKKGSFKDISFDLYKGEIFGIAGLIGSGRSELMQSIFGAALRDDGEIKIDNHSTEIKNVKEAMNLGIAFLPENRHLDGLILMHSIENNIVLPILKRFNKFVSLNYRETGRFVQSEINKFGIKTHSIKMIVENLSGGNQQKVCISKWLATNPKILIVDEPTAGIDVRTKSEIHMLLRKLANEGLSIIMISSEMPELLAHSDRIMIMNKGKNLGIFINEELSQEKIMSIIVNDNIKFKNI